MNKKQFYEKYIILAENQGSTISESTVTPEQINTLEQKYHLKMPQEYKDFISAAAHNITTLNGLMDDLYCEDDVEVELEIPAQPLNNELSEIDELFSGSERYIHAGYLPLGEMDGAYLLCLDTGMDGIFIKYFDHEWCLDHDFTTREEFESDGIMVFDRFEDFISCFFEGKKYDASRCEKYNE